MKLGKHNKIILEPEDIKFLKDNYTSMTNLQLADALGLRLTKCRVFLIELGLKRMEMEYWTQEQVDFLLKNYKKIGDVEMAEIFEATWPKNKKWTKNHICKKRAYLKLIRSKAQIKKIKTRNINQGRWEHSQAWRRLKESKPGTKKVWYHANNTPFVVIKTKKNGFVHYNRWLWEKERGPIPPDVVVTLTGISRINYTIDDLELISKEELARRVSKNRLPPEIREINNLIKKLNREIAKQ